MGFRAKSLQCFFFFRKKACRVTGSRIAFLMTKTLIYDDCVNNTAPDDPILIEDDIY